MKRMESQPKKKQWWKDQSAFTLIEMVIVLFIVSLLMLLVIPGAAKQQKNAAEKGTEALHSVLQSQVDIYLLNEPDQPVTFAKMKAQGYLNDKQLAEAEKQFTVIGSKVEKKGNAGE